MKCLIQLRKFTCKNSRLRFTIHTCYQKSLHISYCPSRHADQKKTFKRRPYQDVFKWFSWEILKDVLKRTSYVRPEKNVLCTSSKGHLMYVLRKTCFIRICGTYKKHLSIFPNAYIYSLHRMSCIHLFFAQNVY